MYERDGRQPRVTITSSARVIFEVMFLHCARTRESERVRELSTISCQLRPLSLALSLSSSCVCTATHAVVYIYVLHALQRARTRHFNLTHSHLLVRCSSCPCRLRLPGYTISQHYSPSTTSAATAVAAATGLNT